MSDEMIRPALTPEEWREFLDPANREWAPLAYHMRSDHAAAACALYGQPFGFSHEDVAALREDGHVGHDVYHPGAPCCDPERRAAIRRSIAARLAALLPETP